MERLNVSDILISPMPVADNAIEIWFRGIAATAANAMVGELVEVDVNGYKFQCRVTGSDLDGMDLEVVPRRIRLSRASGWRLPPNAVNVARPTAWGNPFVIGRHGDREHCVDLYRRLLDGKIILLNVDGTPLDAGSVWHQHRTYDHVVSHLRELRGRDLACWCKPGDICHADVLLELANKPA